MIYIIHVDNIITSNLNTTVYVSLNEYDELIIYNLHAMTYVMYVL